MTHGFQVLTQENRGLCKLLSELMKNVEAHHHSNDYSKRFHIEKNNQVKLHVHPREKSIRRNVYINKININNKLDYNFHGIYIINNAIII